MKLDYEGGNRLLPKFTIDAKVFEQLCIPWKKCLVVKLLGKSIGYLIMKEKLQSTWKPDEGFDLIDVSYGYFMVNFAFHFGELHWRENWP